MLNKSAQYKAQVVAECNRQNVEFKDINGCNNVVSWRRKLSATQNKVSRFVFGTSRINVIRMIMEFENIPIFQLDQRIIIGVNSYYLLIGSHISGRTVIKTIMLDYNRDYSDAYLGRVIEFDKCFDAVLTCETCNKDVKHNKFTTCGICATQVCYDCQDKHHATLALEELDRFNRNEVFAVPCKYCDNRTVPPVPTGPDFEAMVESANSLKMTVSSYISFIMLQNLLDMAGITDEQRSEHEFQTLITEL